VLLRGASELYWTWPGCESTVYNARVYTALNWTRPLDFFLHFSEFLRREDIDACTAASLRQVQPGAARALPTSTLVNTAHPYVVNTVQ